MGRPEFQELQDRPELRNLARSLRPPPVGSWFERLGVWIKRYLQPPPQVNPPPPDTSGFRWSGQLGRNGSGRYGLD